MALDLRPALLPPVTVPAVVAGDPGGSRDQGAVSSAPVVISPVASPRASPRALPSPRATAPESRYSRTDELQAEENERIGEENLRTAEQSLGLRGELETLQREIAELRSRLAEAEPVVRGLQQRQEASAAARRPEAIQGVIQAGLEKADALSALILPAAIVISVPCPVG